MGAWGNEWVWDLGCGDDEDRANRIGIRTSQVTNLIVNTLDNHWTMGFSRTSMLHSFVSDHNYCNTGVLWFLVISSLFVYLCFNLGTESLRKLKFTWDGFPSSFMRNDKGTWVSLSSKEILIFFKFPRTLMNKSEHPGWASDKERSKKRIKLSLKEEKREENYKERGGMEGCQTLFN